MKKVLAAAVVSCFALTAVADEADVKKAVEAKVGKVEKIVRSASPALWEVTVDGQVFYADDKGTYMLFGNLVETRTGKNLTAERQFSSLPLDAAFKQVRGSGKNVLVSFEDPNCGYCKKLAKEMQGLKDVTIYTFLYPILSDDSHDKSKAIWCASDKAKAWNDWMVNGKAPAAASPKCDTAGLDKAIQTGRKLRISGTPALFFANGERVGGYIPVSEIEKRFAASGS